MGRDAGAGADEVFGTTFTASPPEEATKGLLSAEGTRAFIPGGSLGGACGGCLVTTAVVAVAWTALAIRGGGGGKEAARKLGGWERCFWSMGSVLSLATVGAASNVLFKWTSLSPEYAFAKGSLASNSGLPLGRFPGLNACLSPSRPLFCGNV